MRQSAAATHHERVYGCDRFTAEQDTRSLDEHAVSASRVTNTIYPDSSDTTSSGSDQVKVTHNVDGSIATRTDQRGTVIAYSYDGLRRPQSQKVTTLGGSTDGAIRSITRGYDSLGRLAKITSHGKTDRRFGRRRKC